MQENWLTHMYCYMKTQNYLCDKLGFLFLDCFMSQYPLLFVDSIFIQCIQFLAASSFLNYIF